MEVKPAIAAGFQGQGGTKLKKKKLAKISGTGNKRKELER
jgi:hypothetical protein